MTTTQNLIYRLRKRAITTLTLSQAADALEALQADVVRLNMALHGYQVAIETTEESLKDRVALAMEVERLKAAGAVDCGHRPPCTECSDYAAPIPQPPAPSDTAITYMTGYSDGRWWAAAPIPQQPSVPEGWKLVPIEPTEAMLEVGFFAENDVFDSAKTKRIHVWKDMLSAAPQPKDMK